MQFQDNLEILGGNTRRQIKLEVELGYFSIEDKCLNLHRKWYLKEDMVGTTITKDQFTDTNGYYIKEIVIIIIYIFINNILYTRNFIYKQAYELSND